MGLSNGMYFVSSFCMLGISGSSKMLKKEKVRNTKRIAQDEREERKKERKRKESSVDLTQERHEGTTTL